MQLYTWDLGCLSSRRPRQAYTWHMVTSYTDLHLASCSPTLCAAPGRILLLTSSVSRTAAPRSSRLRLPTSLARLPRLSRGSSCHIIMVTIVRWEGGWRHLEAGLHEGEAAVRGLVPESPGRGVAVPLLQLRPPHLAHVPRLSEGGGLRMLRFQKRYCASRDYCVNYHEISMTPLAISRYI